MNERRTGRLPLAARCVTVLLLGACDREGEVARLEHSGGEELRQTAGEKSVELGRAAKSLSRVRCEREKHCQNIGPDQKWLTLDDCRRDLMDEARRDISVEGCPRGALRRQLDECLAEIKRHSCATPLDTLDRLPSCQTRSICDGRW